MFRAYKLISLFKCPTLTNKNIITNEIASKKYILNYSKKTFFKKTNILNLAAAKKDYYSKKIILMI